jgi:hypothetical protein
MALAEDLKSLEEMREKGTLTSKEFAAAKSVAINGGHSVRGGVAPKKIGTSTVSKVVVGVLLLLLGVVWFASVDSPTHLLKSAAHMPMDLTNEVENVRVHSWRGVALTVPYTGSLTVSAQVERGNPIQMFLTDGSGVDKLKAGDRAATYIGAFYAPQARTFQHTERVNQGTYYLVLRDSSLGILSSSASDVSLKVQLAP